MTGEITPARLRWTVKHFIDPDDLAILEAKQMERFGLGAVSYDGSDCAPVWTPAAAIAGSGGAPVRLQLSRQAGFRLQEISRTVNALDAVSVARPGRWGNPFAMAGRTDIARAKAVKAFRDQLAEAGAWIPAGGAHGPVGIEDIRAALAGKNLACWCPPGAPCHGDVLLEIANARPSPGANGGAP